MCDWQRRFFTETATERGTLGGPERILALRFTNTSFRLMNELLNSKFFFLEYLFLSNVCIYAQVVKASFQRPSARKQVNK